MGKPVYLLELTALAWRQYLRSGAPDANGSWYVGRTRVPVNGALTYSQTAVARRSSTANGSFYAGVVFYDASGAQISAPWVAASAVTPGTGFTTYTAQFGASTGIPVPGGAVTMAPAFIVNHGSTLGTMDIREIWIELASAPNVPLTADWRFRDQAEWERVNGTAGGYRTSQGSLVETLTLRYATSAYVTAAADTPPRTVYDARVLNPGQLRMELPPISSSTPGGSITTSYGQIVLNNSDGELGDLAYYGLEGQEFKLFRGDSEAARSTFTEILRGTMQQAVVDRKVVTIRLQGRDAVLDKPVCRSSYAGNNSLPNGLEGGPELANQPKPVLVGGVFNIEPVCVNTARFIYHVGETIAGAAISNVRVGGTALTIGANYTSQADMEANAPAAGQARAWPGGGYFRLGTAPTSGQRVTCDADATETSFGTGNIWWNAMYRLATSAGLGTAEMQFSMGPTFAQPDNWRGTNWPNDQPWVGVWVNDPRTTVRQALNRIAGSFCAWYGFIHWAGSPGTPMKFGAEIFPPPSAGLVVTDYPNLNLSNLLEIKGVADPGEGRGMPVWLVDMGYAQNYTVLAPSDAPGVSPLALGAQELPGKRLQKFDFAIQGKHPDARRLVLETAFPDNPTSVAFECERRLELLRFIRLWFEVRVSMQAVLDMPYKPRLGGYVYLSLPTLRVMWFDGVTRNAGWFTVMALELDFARNEVRMTLRQATEQSI